jgi:hypothetical protein
VPYSPCPVTCLVPYSRCLFSYCALCHIAPVQLLCLGPYSSCFRTVHGATKPEHAGFSVGPDMWHLSQCANFSVGTAATRSGTFSNDFVIHKCRLYCYFDKLVRCFTWAVCTSPAAKPVSTWPPCPLIGCRKWKGMSGILRAITWHDMTWHIHVKGTPSHLGSIPFEYRN